MIHYQRCVQYLDKGGFLVVVWRGLNY